MSVTSGFFNSLNHDRRYSAQQMSAIFDGIINDGVFANIGVAFAITADSGVTINIGVGKAWFNSAWVYNDALLPKTLEGSEVVIDRIDAVVIEVDHSESVRMGDIKIVKGSPSSSPKNPTMANTANKHQYPLAYIYRKAGSTEITQADITNMVGTSSCPYITGILQVQNIDNIVAQWEGQWNQWYAEKITETDTDASELLAEMKSEFDIWFNDIQTLLEDDVATALAAQVAELQGKFDTLAREGAVYDTIEDSEFDPILGSDGTPLQGKTVIGGINEADMSGYAKQEDLEKVKNTKLDRTEKFAVNLLDNSNFREPVNQRDIKSGDTVDQYAYFIDRWLVLNECVVTLSNEGLSVSTGEINQMLNTLGRFVGKPITVACGFSDGVILCGSGIVTNTGEWNTFAWAEHNDRSVFLSNSVSDMWDFRIKCGNGTVEWAALYEGEYTAETLPQYQPKGYAAELTECQRYFVRLRTGADGDRHIGIAHGWTANYAYTILPLPRAMRGDGLPTVSLVTGSKIIIKQNSSATNITPLAVTPYAITAGAVTVHFQTNAKYTYNDTYMVLLNGALDISQDL